MTQPETLTPTSTLQSYLSLKVGRADKNGLRSHGYLHYRILADSDLQMLFITLIGNDGGGCYSKEIVPFDKIEQCLQGVDTRKPIASKLFQPAFIGRSSNNAGFLAAILRAEQLLAPAPGAVHQHAVQPDWAAWKTAMFALAPQAQHYQPELPKQRSQQKTTDKEPSHETHPLQPTGTEPPTAAESGTSDTSESVDGDNVELDDAEMGYLLCDSHGTDITRQPGEDEVETAGAMAPVLHKQQSKKQRSEKRPHPTAPAKRP